MSDAKCTTRHILIELFDDLKFTEEIRIEINKTEGFYWWIT